jgi:PKHD-type hydroxylase
MHLCIAGVVSPEDVAAVAAALRSATFRDGGETAGWHARLVKKNEQAARNGEVEGAARLIDRALRDNALFRMAALPRRLCPIAFSRYGPGMTYGRHIDDAIMGEGEDRIRTDLSVTVYLSEPDSYEGGELVIESMGGEDAIKLSAGSAVVYPTDSLHRVEPVTRGERLVALTWVQSLVRDPSMREILFDLDTARRDIFQTAGKSSTFDLISKSYTNLLRRHSDL